MQKGITLTKKFDLIGGRWHKVEEWTEADAVIDWRHWEEWRKFDSAGSVKRATLRSQCGYMISYTSYSPDGSEKVEVRLLKYISGGPYLGNFDKLNNISDPEYLKLYEKAQKAAAAQGIDLAKEGAFISSSGVAHGFYFPNLDKWRGVFFCRGYAVLVPSRLA